MDSKIATLLSENIKNKQVIAEMIMYICNNDVTIENHLIDLCIDLNANFVTKYTVLNRIDKIKPLCMNYRSNIESVSNIKCVDVNNIARRATIEFEAKVTAWFKDEESANKGNYWVANAKEEGEYKIKGTYITTYGMYVYFKDIDIDIDED